MSAADDYWDDYDANVWPKEDCDCGHRRYHHKSGTGACAGVQITLPLTPESSPTPCRCAQFSDPEPYYDGM